MPLRHSLVWLDAEGWRAVLAQVLQQHLAAITQWCEADWPLTVRRHEVDCPSDTWCVGIALPPLQGDKIRLPFRVAGSAVDRVQAPLSIPQILLALPLDWRDAAIRLHDCAQQTNLAIGVYGSAALQSITGLAYLHASSDLDLLLYPSTCQQLDDCERLFTTFGNALPLDGEIVFGSACAVAAREWCNAIHQEAGFRVLAKHATGVALMRKDALIAMLDDQPCTPT